MPRSKGSGKCDPMVAYRFIVRFINDNGYSPTLREIVDGTIISSTSVANYMIDNLVDKGYIKRRSKIARSITLTEKRP